MNLLRAVWQWSKVDLSLSSVGPLSAILQWRHFLQKNETENSIKQGCLGEGLYTHCLETKGQPLKEPNNPESGMNVLSLRNWDCIRIHCQWFHISVGGIRHYFYHWTLRCPRSEENGAKMHSSAWCTPKMWASLTYRSAQRLLISFLATVASLSPWLIHWLGT